MAAGIYIVVAFCVAWYFESQATTTIVIVRHADVDDPVSLEDDPPLNAIGRARADLLSRFLQYLDVVGGVNAIYAAPYRRARQTAQPLADRLGLEIGRAEPENVEPFMERILREHKGEIVLIVVDRESIAPLIEELHGSKRVPEIAPDEYENLYIVTIPWGGGAKVKTLRLLYGLDWKPADNTWFQGAASPGLQ